MRIILLLFTMLWDHTFGQLDIHLIQSCILVYNLLLIEMVAILPNTALSVLITDPLFVLKHGLPRYQHNLDTAKRIIYLPRTQSVITAEDNIILRNAVTYNRPLIACLLMDISQVQFDVLKTSDKHVETGKPLVATLHNLAISDLASHNFVEYLSSQYFINHILPSTLQKPIFKEGMKSLRHLVKAYKRLYKDIQCCYNRHMTQGNTPALFLPSELWQTYIWEHYKLVSEPKYTPVLHHLQLINYSVSTQRERT